MADESGDKTEAPTPKKRQEARDQGNIAKSMDLTASVVLLSAIVLLDVFGPRLFGTMREILAEQLALPGGGLLSPSQIMLDGARFLAAVAMAGAPLFLSLILLAVAGHMAQVGFIFNFKRLEPKLSALNPQKGIKKIFGGKQAIVQLLMNILKIVIVSMVAYSAIHHRLLSIVSSQQLEFMQIFGLGAEILYAIAIRVAIILLILALIDYGWQKFRTEQELKMSKQEVKDEMKRMDGDPQIKMRRRQIAMQMARNRLRKDVPTADVVVTNPTEYAVALKYESGSMRAPVVVAKGQGLMAAYIRRLAIENGVPIIERKPLARALYKTVEVGQEIPEELYSAVAEILAYVYELSGKLRGPRRVSA